MWCVSNELMVLNFFFLFVQTLIFLSYNLKAKDRTPDFVWRIWTWPVRLCSLGILNQKMGFGCIWGIWNWASFESHGLMVLGDGEKGRKKGRVVEDESIGEKDGPLQIERNLVFRQETKSAIWLLMTKQTVKTAKIIRRHSLWATRTELTYAVQMK